MELYLLFANTRRIILEKLNTLVLRVYNIIIKIYLEIFGNDQFDF